MEKQKTAVVTGATRGIGLGLAREFLKRGVNVVICGRSQTAVDEALKDLSAAPGEARALRIRLILDTSTPTRNC